MSEHKTVGQKIADLQQVSEWGDEQTVRTIAGYWLGNPRLSFLQAIDALSQSMGVEEALGDFDEVDAELAGRWLSMAEWEEEERRQARIMIRDKIPGLALGPVPPSEVKRTIRQTLQSTGKDAASLPGVTSIAIEDPIAEDQVIIHVLIVSEEVAEKMETMLRSQDAYTGEDAD